jgi:hypothetical protein
VKKLWVLVLLPLVAWTSAPKIATCTYLPLAEGNWWEYVEMSLHDQTIKLSRQEINSDTLINDTLYYRMDFSTAQPPGLCTFYRCAENKLYSRIKGDKVESVVIPGDTLGAAFFDSIRPFPSTEITSINATLTTPNEVYDSLLCVTVKYSKATRLSIYYKKNVGIVGVVDAKDGLTKYLRAYSVK